MTARTLARFQVSPKALLRQVAKARELASVEILNLFSNAP